jgi:site-specific recombinase XerD
LYSELLGCRTALSDLNYIWRATELANNRFCFLYTILSEIALKTFKEYVEKYKPEKWLFPGQRKDKHITTRTVQKIFENAYKKAEIAKDVTVHSLRHSFATHFLESGTDIRYIQELLGHKGSKTTEIYTHVAMRDLRKIRSPPDMIKGEKDG